MPTASPASSTSPADFAFPEVTGSDAGLRRFLHGLSGVDSVGLTARAAALGTRSLKKDTKAFALDLAIRMVDLTTLEGADTPGRVRALCAKARHPDPTDQTTPSVAAVCVYPDLAGVARAALHPSGSEPDDDPGDDPGGGCGVRVASVATAFPSGRAGMPVKLADTAEAVAAGADEVDMVLDRGAFLAGRYLETFETIQRVRRACARPDGPDAHLKVILETGELSSYDTVRRASWLAMLAGADFIKTSTGKVAVNATPPVTLLMLQAVRDFHQATGRRVGVKAAGGIRTAKEAVSYLAMLHETLPDAWLSPELFRFGASSLLNDLLMQRQKLATGRYSGPDHVTVD